MDPAEKYQDQVDPKHALAMQTIGLSYKLLAPQMEQIERFLNAEEQSHAIGHILDPTLYRDQINSKSFASQVTMAKSSPNIAAI